MTVSISTSNPLSFTTWQVMPAPEAIQACVASLAAEAFDAGHARAAQVLAHTAALLKQADLWNVGQLKP